MSSKVVNIISLSIDVFQKIMIYIICVSSVSPIAQLLFNTRFFIELEFQHKR